MLISVSDIAKVYLFKQLRAGSVTRNTALPLCDININFNFPHSVAELMAQLVNKLCKSKSKPQKTDPIAASFNEANGLTAAMATDLAKFAANLKTRENHYPELNRILMLMADNVQETEFLEKSGLILDHDGKPIVLVKMGNRAPNLHHAAELASEFAHHIANPESPYYGCSALYVYRQGSNHNQNLLNANNPKHKKMKNLDMQSMSLQHFYSLYSSDRNIYINALLFVAVTMHKSGNIAHDFDMSQIFSLLN